MATRPLADRALVMAKWQAAMLSTIAAWVIVIFAVPVAVIWADAAQPIIDVAHNVSSAIGRPRAIALAALILVGLVVSTWKQLVQGLYIAMRGRDWAVKGMVFAALALITVGSFALIWISNSRYRVAVVLYSIPWLMAACVALRLVLAAIVMKRGVARTLFTPKQLIFAAIGWDVSVLAIYGVLAVILPEVLFRRYFLLLIAILVVPFVRLAATPLAVAENRHR
jgi:hypothetical protein